MSSTSTARTKLTTHPRATMVAQFMKFGVVGVSNTLLTLAVYTLLFKVFGVWYIAASAIGFAVGAVNGFLLNRSWTFRGHAGGPSAALRWMIVQGCALLVNLGVVYLLVSGAGLDKLAGQACATLVVVVLTFFVNRRWTFRVHLGQADPDVARRAVVPPAGVR